MVTYNFANSDAMSAPWKLDQTQSLAEGKHHWMLSSIPAFDPVNLARSVNFKSELDELVAPPN